MTILSIQLVIADVDGTLLTHDKVLTKRAIAAVQALGNAGVKLALTSGRPPRGLSMLVGRLSIDVPMAAFNGGVYVRPDLSPIEALTIAPDVAARLERMMERHGLDVWIYAGNDWLVRHFDAPHVARERSTVGFPPRVVASFDGLRGCAAKMVGVSDDHRALASCLAEAREQFPGEISAALSQPYYLDLTHPDANKGRVVERMSELLGVPRLQVAAIGDMPNDVPMFRMAGFSIAMGHSSDDVKRAATVVTGSSEEEGFARAMEQHVLAARPAR